MPGKYSVTQLIFYLESSCKTIKLMANGFENNSVNSRSSISASPFRRRAVALVRTPDASIVLVFQKRRPVQHRAPAAAGGRPPAAPLMALPDLPLRDD